MERAYHVMLKAALPILGRDTGKRASIAREETVGILGDHWLESVGQAPRREMTAAGQKKRQRHNEKIKSLKRSKDSAVREALGLMATIPAEEHSDFVAAIELLKSKALRDAAIAEHDAAAAAEEMDVTPMREI